MLRHQKSIRLEPLNRVHARTDITSHTVSDQLCGHRHKGAYVAIVLDGGYDELSADGAWYVRPGDLVVHPQFHFHANTFRGNTRVLNWRIPGALSAHATFQTYQVIRPNGCDDLLSADGDLAALQEAMSRAEAVTAVEPGDWVDLMAQDLAANPCIPIANLARRFSVSPEHASRRFRQRYLMTPTMVRSERRFRHALELLQRTCHSLGEIAQMAGYADQPHFTRSCQQVTGLSPGRLRRALP